MFFGILAGPILEGFRVFMRTTNSWFIFQSFNYEFPSFYSQQIYDQNSARPTKIIILVSSGLFPKVFIIQSFRVSTHNKFTDDQSISINFYPPPY